MGSLRPVTSSFPWYPIYRNNVDRKRQSSLIELPFGSSCLSFDKAMVINPRLENRILILCNSLFISFIRLRAVKMMTRMMPIYLNLWGNIITDRFFFFFVSMYYWIETMDIIVIMTVIYMLKLNVPVSIAW